MILWAKDLPNSLVVKSVATITRGKLNAAHVTLNPKKAIGIDTKMFDKTIIQTCAITR